MQKQNEKEALVCTHGNCKELQTEDGEFCQNHFPRKEFEIEIIETLSKVITVEASSSEEAIEKVKKGYFANEYILTGDNANSEPAFQDINKENRCYNCDMPNLPERELEIIYSDVSYFMDDIEDNDNLSVKEKREMLAEREDILKKVE